MVLYSQIYASIQHVQEAVTSNNERLKPALQPIGLLHLTMFMMHLATEEEVERLVFDTDSTYWDLISSFSSSI